MEDSRLVRPHFSVPNGAGAFGEVTCLSSPEDDDESSVSDRGRDSTNGHKPSSVFPTFGYQAWGAMGRSRHASCGFQVRPNGDRKRIVFKDGILYPAETEVRISPCCSISRRTISLEDRERDGSQGHACRVHTWIVGSGIGGIRGPGAIEEGSKANMRILRLFLCGAGMELVGIWRGSCSRYA